MVGQTQDGLFQVGVSKTIRAPASDVWRCVDSADGITLIVADADTPPPELPRDDLNISLAALDTADSDGIRAKTTTCRAGSHVRMQWQAPEWESHSILQIRVTPKTDGSCTLSFHQEKLPSEPAREAMRRRWRKVAAWIASRAGGGVLTVD